MLVVNCSFSVIHELDMDILILESTISDLGFTDLVLSETQIKGQVFCY